MLGLDSVPTPAIGGQTPACSSPVVPSDTLVGYLVLMGPTASHTGRRADGRRGAPPRREPAPRRAAEVRRDAQEYERELRRQELAIGRSLTGVLPSDRPARIRELVEARRVLSAAIRDLQRVVRDLETDLERYRAQRSHQQREVLAYEAVAGEIEEVLLRWEARREQLSATIERGNRRQGQGRQGGEGRQGSAGRQGGAGRNTPTAGRNTPATGRGPAGERSTGDRGRSGGRSGGAQGRTGARGDHQAGRERTDGGQGRSGGRQAGRRGGPADRSGADRSRGERKAPRSD
jgi:hypothetical protein